MRAALLTTSLAATGVAAAAVTLAGGASATPGSGVSASTLAKGTVAERVHIRSHGDEQTDVLVQEHRIAPGGTTGWHSHPGSVVVVIESGTFTVRSQHGGTCVSDVYGEGDAFVDPGRGHRHVGTNLGSDDVVLTVTFFQPAGSPSPRVDVAAQDVPPACAD